MKTALIKQGIDHAVVIPAKQRTWSDTSAPVKAVVHSITPDGKVRVVLHPDGRELNVAPASVKSTWLDFVVDRAHAHALSEEGRRTFMAEYEAEKAVEDAAMERWLPAFDGVMVPPTGYSNVARPDENLADELRDAFIRSRSGSYSARVGVFAAIAERIAALQDALLAQESAWGDGPVDTGMPVFEYAPPSVDAILGRLDTLIDPEGDGKHDFLLPEDPE